jgi:phosphatidylglycerophosphate synthase
MKTSKESSNRRPVKSRSTQAFHKLAAHMVHMGVSPNQVSVMSAAFAIGGGFCLFVAGSGVGPGAKLSLIFGCLLGIQLRLVCNLIDGLMAVEGGKRTPAGEFFNDFPDRISDVALILAAGFAMDQSANDSFTTPLAWAAALLAVLTAYVRVLGASMGTPHFFLGPMAKQHRMAVLNIALLGSAVEVFQRGSFHLSLTTALAIIALGSAITSVRRALAILRFFDVSANNRS